MKEYKPVDPRGLGPMYTTPEYDEWFGYVLKGRWTLGNFIEHMILDGCAEEEMDALLRRGGIGVFCVLNNNLHHGYARMVTRCHDWLADDDVHEHVHECWEYDFRTPEEMAPGEEALWWTPVTWLVWREVLDEADEE